MKVMTEWLRRSRYINSWLKDKPYSVSLNALNTDMRKLGFPTRATTRLRYNFGICTLADLLAQLPTQDELIDQRGWGVETHWDFMARLHDYGLELSVDKPEDWVPHNETTLGNSTQEAGRGLDEE